MTWNRHKPCLCPYAPCIIWEEWYVDDDASNDVTTGAPSVVWTIGVPRLGLLQPRTELVMEMWGMRCQLSCTVLLYRELTVPGRGEVGRTTRFFHAGILLGLHGRAGPRSMQKRHTGKAASAVDMPHLVLSLSGLVPRGGRAIGCEVERKYIFPSAPPR